MKEKGTLKKGTHLLVSNSAEYFVMAELLRQEIVTGLLPRNTPNYDIIAVKGKKTAKIRVKYKAQTSGGWQWTAKGHPHFVLKDITKNDFTVLVNITSAPLSPEYFILKSSEVEKILQKGFERWVKKPGKRGKPRSKSNKHRLLRYEKHQKLLDSRRGKWEFLWE